MKKLFVATVLGSFLLAAASAQATDYGVMVECWSQSGCDSISLGTACSSVIPGSTPVSISCSQVRAPATTTSCGSGTCGWRDYVRSAANIGAFCSDTNGYDALIICRQ